ncbi:putative addiction module antidote protein [Allorhizobium sp. BGMRC 0089]|uniref:addiction module antidote protein n=1 Tax=Allorhizobium sonneratiae TaxID=2934936 RepID=UPI0020336BC5|nr:addiction module antidote protein [Allorhizobium sonneratiae]MCM2294763.1 putative addiction module antidote protein [Allorhizobium sonneratiae]
MAIETTAWDSAEFLDSPEAVAAYLEAALEDGDPKVVAVALGNIARARGMSSVAAEAGITREALYKSLSKRGDPKLSTLLSVMSALGLRLTVASKDAA